MIRFKILYRLFYKIDQTTQIVRFKLFNINTIIVPNNKIKNSNTKKIRNKILINFSVIPVVFL